MEDLIEISEKNEFNTEIIEILKTNTASSNKIAKNNNIIKNNKLYKKQKYENEPMKCFEDGKIEKNNKKLKLEKKNEKMVNNYYASKSYNNFNEDKAMLNNLNLQKKYNKKNKDKFNEIHIHFFYLFIIIEILFSQFIKCNQREIKFASSYIKLKTKGTGYIQLYYQGFLSSRYKPSIISINSIINLTGSEIKNTYNFNNKEDNINNVTLIWINYPSYIDSMFLDCINIIEIDLSNFDTSRVTVIDEMFEGCSSLISLDLSNFNTSGITSMYRMFEGCSSLISLDLSNFNTSGITSMSRMFYGCSSLKSLDLSNFDTSSVKEMTFMFSGCSSLASLDISNFNTCSVKFMYNMFSGCSSLTILNLSNFDTSSVEVMGSMFLGCSSLTSLDLSNFDTSRVTFMNSMFAGCSSLTCVDLSNFDTSSVEEMGSMFYGCSSLKSLNLSNFDTSMVTIMYYMFDGCSSLTSLDLSNFDTSRVTRMTNIFSGCSSLKSLDLSNFNMSEVTSITDIFDNCEKLEYVNLKNAKIDSSLNKGGINPPNLIICSLYEEWQTVFSLSEIQYINCINNISSFKIDENIGQMKCFKENKDLNNPCQICGTNYFEKNMINNNITYINCYEYKEGYYFDDDILNYKPCYSSCKKCDKNGSEIEHNCIECKDDYKLKINISIYKNCFIDISNYLKTDIISGKENNIKNRTEIIQNMVKKLFTQLNISNIDIGNYTKIVGNNLSLIMTSTKNQKYIENNYIIIIDLCKCENILKNEYNISINDSLYILQYIFEEEGMKIPKVEYEVYFPLYENNTLAKLNLTLCKGMKIHITIPVKIYVKIDRHNPKSNYYNNICYKTTSKSGTDISLKDRRNEFVENNMTLCEEKCELIDYDYTKEKVKCSCKIKTKINYDIKFNKKEFYKSFADIKNIANINILKCYKIVLDVKNMINNIGFYIMDSIIALYFITIFIFWFKSYKKLMMDFYLIYIALNNIKSIEENPNIEGNKTKIKIVKKRNIKNSINKLPIINNYINNNNDINYKNNVEQTTQDNQDKTTNKLNITKILKIKSYNKNNQYIKEILEKKDFEINSLEYEEAFKLDKRSFIQYYISLLRYNHPLIFSFGNFNDYNSRIIKIFLFFFSFSSGFTINALFFNDDTMHKIYQDKGKYNILFQIPKILYSTLISVLISSLIKNLALSQDKIVELKQEKGKNNFEEKYNKTLKIFRIKIILFFVLAFIILSFCWYYITCFCGIYVNTQIHLIKDTIISLITSLIYPFALNLIPGIFRISALRIEKPSRKCLYKFSSFLQTIA